MMRGTGGQGAALVTHGSAVNLRQVTDNVDATVITVDKLDNAFQRLAPDSGSEQGDEM